MFHTRYLITFFLIVCLSVNTRSQTLRPPVANFSFNHKKTSDDVAQLQAKFVGIYYTADRFENEDNAVFLQGSESSYINLGNDSRLKQRTGSISLWVNMEHKIWAGNGVKCNPIILTKYTNLDDYYESYAIYYMLETNRLIAVCMKDSVKAVGVFSPRKFERNRWHHVVMTYDDDFMCLYIDDQLQSKLEKKFETKFISTDSVMIGSLANKKNYRFFNGTVDDIEFYDYVLSPEEVSNLYRAPNPNIYKLILKWVFMFFAIAGIILSGYFYVRFRIRKAVWKEKRRLELDYKLLETELRVNRASMNPHFLFNSLNTLHSFILAEELQEAGDYLVKFSKLIRKTLESNMYEGISLQQEMELLERYLEIENMRFEENISYSFTTAKFMRPSAITIPIMMLQPFIENAIWHGLLNKPGEKIIRISFAVTDETYLYCEIEDNGVGRKQTKPNPFEKTSMATAFIMQRLELLNKIHRLNCTLRIEDKPHHTGTIVKLTLPILKK